MPDTSVRVHRGSDAIELIERSEFQAQWRSLFTRCPWGTCMQLPSYVCTWYRHYDDVYEPLILCRFESGAELRGLLTLAVEKASGGLTFAGAHQAEYQVWLSDLDERGFIRDALDTLGGLGFSELRFQYAPPGTPLEWLSENRKSPQNILVVNVIKPVMRIDAEEIRSSFKKKGNRSRINRLERDGKLNFCQIHTAEELDAEAPDLTLFTDFRQGAVNGSLPFRNDPRKYPFHRALMQFPDLVHVTVTRAGGKFLAAHIGFHNRCQVILGIITHSPFLAEHSPGKFHILYLAHLLSEQGITGLDLTPGGDPYKDRFATETEQAHAVTVFFNRRAWLKASAMLKARAAVRLCCRALGLNPQKLRPGASRAGSVYRKLRSSPIRVLKSALRILVRRFWSTTEMRFYRMPVSAIQMDIPTEVVRRDSISDLLCYEPAENWPASKQAFLRSAMSRIEQGSHFYTCVLDGLLVHYGWVSIGQTKAFITEVEHTYEYPPNSAVLWDYNTHPRYRGRGLYSNSLRQILRDTAKVEGVEYIYIAVLADNQASRRVIEKTGFQYHGSIIRRKRFMPSGHTQRT